MRRILFARIGYMRYYAGQQKGDERPRHGGSFNDSDIGHELYNFKNAAGSLYGYFQPYLKPGHDITLNLQRIDPQGRPRDTIDRVMVVFVSRSDTKGQVVVGWYRNATVHRAYQAPTTSMLRDDFAYHLVARTKDSVLLPEKLRIHSIPKGKGAFGRANVVYPFDANGKPCSTDRQSWIQQAIDYIDAYDGPNILESPEANIEDAIAELAENEESARNGRGIQVDAHTRKQIEAFAVARAEKRFRGLGYNVAYVGDRRSYDLECSKGSRTLRVEVKGTQTDGTMVILTTNEVASARRNRSALYILHSIRWIRIGGARHPFGGKETLLNPWDVDQDGSLAALSYNYKIRHTHKAQP